MRQRGRALAAALAVAAIAQGGCKPPATQGPAAGEAPPLRLVVLVVIDQWPSWGFEARRDLFAHGLRRLVDEGVVYPEAEFPYAITYTAPGHATLATGAPPSVTGIVANGWWRRAQGKERQAEADDTVTILPLPGRSSAGLEGASGAPLRVEGVADVLRRETGGRARSVVIGGKPRAACLVAGRRPDVVLWYEPKVAGLTSSTAYGDALPAWALAFDREHPVASYLDDEWTTDDAMLLRTRTGIPDDAAGEGAEHGLGIAFPYKLASTTDAAKALRSTPFLDRVEIDAAMAAVAGEQLGADDVADLLVVSLSAHDYVGHNWGQESWEIVEHERALDRELGRLLAFIDGEVGSDRYAVVVTSDHGATPVVEHGRHPGARRIPPAELEAAAEEAAATVLGVGDWVSALSSAMVYLSPAALARAPTDRAAALAAITARLSTVPNIARVIALDALP
ncbi:MAG: alkaline phosphatase family protein, partial [Deltaproteobacteria bacterium]|nr:alkaline phosphatase family protein [Kofleriaceae bacterium]